MIIEDEKQYFYFAGAEKIGPIDGMALKKLASAGAIDQESQIFEVGTEDWISASNCEGLFEPKVTLADVPPPSAATIPQPSTSVPAQKSQAVAGTPIQASGSRPAATGLGRAYRSAYFSRQSKVSFPKYLVFSVLALLLSGVSVLLRGHAHIAPRGRKVELQEWALYCWIGAVIFGLITLFTICVILYRAWFMLQILREERTTPDKAVGFHFVPFFNLYWMFVAWVGWSREYNRLTREEIPEEDAPKLGEFAFLIPLILMLVTQIGGTLIQLGFYIPDFNLGRKVVSVIYILFAIMLVEYVLWYRAIFGMSKGTNYLVNVSNANVRG